MATKVETLTPEAVMAAVNKQFGAGTMKMADDESLTIIKHPTGVLAFDEAMQGGVARGRFIEIYGAEGIGKTALAMCIVAAVQAAGGRAAWVDCENRFHKKFAKHIGVKTKELAYHEQDSGPVAVDFMDTLLRSRLWDVIVLDSIASLIPKEEHDKSMSAGSMGMEQAKLMSKALRKLTSANTSQGAIVVMLNQTREAVGVMFGDKTTTSGGRAMRFYASTRIEMVRIETLKKSTRVVNQKTGEITYEDRPYAHRIMVKVKKDSTGVREGESTTLVFDYDLQNFDVVEDLIYCGRLYGLVHKGTDPRPKKTKGKQKKTKGDPSKKKGSWWWVDEHADKAVNGRAAFKKFLEDNDEIRNDLEEWIRNSFEPDDETEDD